MRWLTAAEEHRACTQIQDAADDCIIKDLRIVTHPQLTHWQDHIVETYFYIPSGYV